MNGEGNDPRAGERAGEPTSERAGERAHERAHERAGDLEAGEFGAWFGEISGAIRGTNDADVPCGSCNSCCKSSQFIHIEPDEHATLKRIPKRLLVAAPGLAKGNVLMGYDERGHCPMLKNDACSIYEYRPRTCRAYDCRVFAASGVSLDDDDKPLIDAQVARWRFAYASDTDRALHLAVQAAAEYLNVHRDELGDAVPRNPTQLAALAIEIHELFMNGARPNAEVVRVGFSR